MHANWQKEILAITPPLQFPIDENERKFSNSLLITN